MAWNGNFGEILVCELRRSCKKKILMAVFYPRPPPPLHPLAVRTWLSSQNFPAKSSGRNSINSSLLVIKLEYAIELWSPYTCKDKLLLENIQRRATKFSLNYPKDMSYKDRLLKLNLLPLEYRRDLKDLVRIFKVKAGHVDLGHQDFFRQTEIHQRTRNILQI